MAGPAPLTQRARTALAHFASVATSIAAMVVSQPAAKANDKAFGEYLASACVTCHQVSGQQTAGVPPIVGLPEDAFIALMTAYRSGQRTNQVMQAIAAPLEDNEIAALAAYFGSIRPK